MEAFQPTDSDSWVSSLNSVQHHPSAVERPSTTSREVAVRGSHVVTSFDPNPAGAGRILHYFYSAAAQTAGTLANHTAHRFGKGPIAATKRIHDAFGSSEDRLLKLDHVYSDPKESAIKALLAKECSTLIKYAYPSDSRSPETRLQAFDSIVVLVTQYPGLRRFFSLGDEVRSAERPNAQLLALWDKDNDNGDHIWCFYMRLAVACILNEEISTIVEATWPSRLGEYNHETLSIIEKLLARTVDDCFSLSSRIAIRYLGGILKLPTFWLAANYHHNRLLAKKIFSTTQAILKDVGVLSSAQDMETMIAEISSDTRGVDFLGESILAGVMTWNRHISATSIITESWFEDFAKLLELFQRPAAAELLPNSWRLALAGEFQRLLPAIYEAAGSGLEVYIAEPDTHDSHGSDDNLDHQPSFSTNPDRPLSINSELRTPTTGTLRVKFLSADVLPVSTKRSTLYTRIQAGDKTLKLRLSGEAAESKCRGKFDFKSQPAPVQISVQLWGGRAWFQRDLFLGGTNVNIWAHFSTEGSSRIDLSTELNPSAGLVTLRLEFDDSDNESKENIFEENDSLHRPSSLLEHINAATHTTISGAGDSPFDIYNSEGGDRDIATDVIASDSNFLAKMTSRPAHARYSFDGTNDGELAISAGARLEVLDDRDAAWWYVRDARTDREGVVPASYLY